MSFNIFAVEAPNVIENIHEVDPNELLKEVNDRLEKMKTYVAEKGDTSDSSGFEDYYQKTVAEERVKQERQQRVKRILGGVGAATAVGLGVVGTGAVIGAIIKASADKK